MNRHKWEAPERFARPDQFIRTPVHGYSMELLRLVERRYQSDHCEIARVPQKCNAQSQSSPTPRQRAFGFTRAPPSANTQIPRTSLARLGSAGRQGWTCEMKGVSEDFPDVHKERPAD